MEKYNSHEEHEWLENYQKQLLHENEMMLSEHESTIESFIEYCSNIGIILEKSNFYFVPTIGVVAEYPGIVTHLVSDLSIDKENLVH